MTLPWILVARQQHILSLDQPPYQRQLKFVRFALWYLQVGCRKYVLCLPPTLRRQQQQGFVTWTYCLQWAQPFFRFWYLISWSWNLQRLMEKDHSVVTQYHATWAYPGPLEWSPPAFFKIHFNIILRLWLDTASIVSCMEFPSKMFCVCQ
jgi:hypothetical protein